MRTNANSSHSLEGEYESTAILSFNFCTLLNFFFGNFGILLNSDFTFINYTIVNTKPGVIKSESAQLICLSHVSGSVLAAVQCVCVILIVNSQTSLQTALCLIAIAKPCRHTPVC